MMYKIIHGSFVEVEKQLNALSDKYTVDTAMVKNNAELVVILKESIADTAKEPTREPEKKLFGIFK